jgi:antitoxin component of MazEF toxin-antitoxin module
MARTTLANRFNRNLIELGKGSLCITLPKEYLEELGWEKGVEINVTIRRGNKELVLKKVPETTE